MVKIVLAWKDFLSHRLVPLPILYNHVYPLHTYIHLAVWVFLLISCASLKTIYFEIVLPDKQLRIYNHNLYLLNKKGG